MELKEALREIYKVAKEHYDLQSVPKLHLRKDEENAKGVFGKTAHYNPSDNSIIL